MRKNSKILVNSAGIPARTRTRIDVPVPEYHTE